MKMALMLIQWRWKWFHLSALPLLQNLFCLPSLLNNLQKIMMIMILMIRMICPPLLCTSCKSTETIHFRKHFTFENFSSMDFNFFSRCGTDEET